MIRKVSGNLLEADVEAARPFVEAGLRLVAKLHEEFPHALELKEVSDGPVVPTRYPLSNIATKSTWLP